MSPFELLAMLITGVFCYLIYVSWKTHSTLLAWLGWLGLFANLSTWILASGPEFGVIYALFLPSIFVWLGIFSELKILKTSTSTPKRTAQWRWQPKKIGKTVSISMYLLVGLLVISSLVSISLVYLLPIKETSQMALGIILLPILWGCLAFWFLASMKKLTPVLVSVVSAVASSLFLFG